MKNVQPFQDNRTSILPVIIILVSLFLAFAVTYDLFVEYQSKSEEYATAQTAQNEAGKTLERLDRVKSETQDGKSDIQKYIQEFREDTIYQKLFDTVGTDGKVGAVSIQSGEVLTSGLTLANVSFTLDVADMSNLLAFLDRATDENGKQRFLIKNISFPYSSGNPANITASITLGMYTIK